jgi:SAM-dependent methyltransferase
MNRELIAKYLRTYLGSRPLFLSLIRSTEAALYAPHLPLRGPVLDVGCGDGYFAQTVFRTVDVGLDVGQSRIAEAKGKQVYGKLVTYDGRIFPFKNATFQTVVSNCVFEHIPDIRLLVSEIHRVLKPGGTLITTVMAKPWEEYLFGAMLMGNSYREYMRRKQVHLNLYTRIQWDAVFADAGFRIDTRTGYMDQGACRLMDISHYLSVPSLASYVLFKKWVLWPWMANLYPVSYLSGRMAPSVGADRAGAIFYIVRK